MEPETTTYVVRPGCWLAQNGKIVRAGEKIELTPLQANDMTIKGSIELPTATAHVPEKTPAVPAAASRPVDKKPG